MNIAERAEFYEQELIGHRRWLHQHAELAWKEFKTTEYIERYLEDLGLEPMKLGDMTGCYAYIRGGQAGPNTKTILLLFPQCVKQYTTICTLWQIPLQ